MINEKSILENGVINFFYRKEEYRSLSNFWNSNVIIISKNNESREYESGEHAFHGEKYILLGQICQDEIRKNILLEYGHKFMKPSSYKTGADVKKMGGKRGLMLNKDELDIWNDLSIDVQIEICKYKWDHYEDVKKDLLRSKGKILVHPAMRCSEKDLKNRLWEGKAVIIDGKIVILGKNMLGTIWMRLRDDVDLRE